MKEPPNLDTMSGYLGNMKVSSVRPVPSPPDIAWIIPLSVKCRFSLPRLMFLHPHASECHQPMKCSGMKLPVKHCYAIFYHMIAR